MSASEYRDRAERDVAGANYFCFRATEFTSMFHFSVSREISLLAYQLVAEECFTGFHCQPFSYVSILRLRCVNNL